MGGPMLGLNTSRKSPMRVLRSFYCRMQNRVMTEGCPLSVGPDACPLRQECPAYSIRFAETRFVKNPTIIR
jgi:hypothetical protein